SITALRIAPRLISPRWTTTLPIAALSIAFLPGRQLLAFGRHAGARFPDLVLARIVRLLRLRLRTLRLAAAAARMALAVVPRLLLLLPSALLLLLLWAALLAMAF